MLKMLILAVKNALISKLKQMWQQGLNLNRFPLLYGKDTEKRLQCNIFAHGNTNSIKI